MHSHALLSYSRVVYNNYYTEYIHNIVYKSASSSKIRTDLPRSNGTARLSRPAWPNSVEWSVVLEREKMMLV